MSDNNQPPAALTTTVASAEAQLGSAAAPAPAPAGEDARTTVTTTTTMTTTTKTETAEEAPAPAAPAAAGAAGLAAALSAVAALAALAVSSPHAVPPASHFCIDVECVATGPTHNDRAVAQIALVVSEAVKLFLDPPPRFFPSPSLDPLFALQRPPSTLFPHLIHLHPSIHRSILLSIRTSTSASSSTSLSSPTGQSPPT